MSAEKRIIAIDIGNSRIKLACYLLPLSQSNADSIEPDSTFDLDHQFHQQESAKTSKEAEAKLQHWLSSAAERSGPVQSDVYLSSVNGPQLQQMVSVLGRIVPDVSCHILSHAVVPLTIKLEQPDKIGLDRLMAAVAANRMRDSDQPAVLIDVGSAITIDWLSELGEFCGGVIFPGIAMSAKAMHQQTDQLPLIDMKQLTNPPDVLGLDTESAMRSGLYYSAVGAMREVIARLSAHFEQRPLIVLTGGAAPAVAKQLDNDCLFCPSLILDGIALTANSLK